MNKHTKILVAITLLLGLGMAANAETRREIRVTLPFGFVAGKTTLPAGNYLVERISDQPFNVLMITNYNTGTSVFVNPVEMEDASTYKPSMSFRAVGDQHFLSGIQTGDYVYNFRVSSSVTLEAAAKPSDTVPVSEVTGSD
jgi:hypothetical protein